MTEFLLNLRLKPASASARPFVPTARGERPHPGQYLTIFLLWGLALLWFHPRLISLLDMADRPLEWAALIFFVIFVELAWLYGFYNIGVVLFALIYRRLARFDIPPPPLSS